MARAEFQAKKGLNGSTKKETIGWIPKGYSGVSKNNPDSLD